MDLSWGHEALIPFITNVGLITSDGPNGPNIMAAEWTHHVSYRPGLIAVHIGPHKATAENIRKTKQFGVNICATDQAVMSSISGNYSGREIDKIAALKELGFKFYKAKKIKTLMVEGAAMNAECKLVEEIPLGDHIMFVGEVIEASASGKDPFAYHQGRYWLLNTNVIKTSQEERERIRSVVEKHRKSVIKIKD